MTTDELLAALKTAFATMADPLDLPHQWSSRQLNAYEQTRREASSTISMLMNVDNDLVKPCAQLAQCRARRDAITAKQAELDATIANFADYSTIRDGRERDTERDRQEMVKRQLTMLHAGTLLLAPLDGEYEPWCAAPLALDQRIDELQTRIAMLQQRHDSAVRAAPALLAALTEYAQLLEFLRKPA